MFWFLVFTTGLVLAVYKYLTWNFGYWKRQGVKAAKPWPIFGSTGLDLKKMKAPHTFDVECYRKFGKIYGTYGGRNPILNVADPDLIRQILVKDFPAFQNRQEIRLSEKEHFAQNCLPLMEGEKWKNLRNVLTPTFTSGKLKNMFSLVEECAESFVEYIEDKTNQPVELTRLFATVTMDVFATCAFGSKIDSIRDTKSPFFVNFRKIFHSIPTITMIMSVVNAKLMKYCPPAYSPEAIQYLASVVNDVIEIRKKAKQTKCDLLQLLLEVQEQNEKDGGGKVFMTHDVMVSQSIMFMAAGQESTTSSLAYGAYELATNYDVQEKLIREIDDTLTRHKGQLTYESIHEMQYMDMVINEILRKHPPATRIERRCSQDDYDLNGIKLTKGMVVIVPTYAIHHDPDFYPEPEVFDPERFNAENKRKRSPFHYLPFGHGPRNCIGMRFATMEMKIVLFVILKSFRFVTCSETEFPLKEDGTSAVGLRQPESITLKLEKRTDRPAKYYDETFI